MGHQREVWLDKFFARHRSHVEHMTPKTIVARALEEWERDRALEKKRLVETAVRQLAKSDPQSSAAREASIE